MKPPPWSNLGIRKLDLIQGRIRCALAVSPIGVEISQAYAGQMLVNRKRKIPSRYALRGPGMISITTRKAEQPLSKAIVRNPLVILDQQLQSLAKEGDDATRKQKRGRGRR
jgi:hypothetical protein